MAYSFEGEASLGRAQATMSESNNNTSDAVGLSEDILRDAFEVWKDDQDSGAPVGDDRIATLLARALESLIEKLKPLSADLGMAQFTRSIIPGTPGETHEPVIKVTVGPLSTVVPPGLYRESYPFLRWHADETLRLRILNVPDFSSIVSETLPRNCLISPLALITEAAARSEDDDAKINWFMEQLPEVIRNNFSSDVSLRLAIAYAIFSTAYTRSLMNNGVCYSSLPDGETGGCRPPYSERNLTYVPVFVRGECVGGGVIYSRRCLPDKDIQTITSYVHIVLYRLRSGDDLAAAAVAAKSKAQWDATLLYTHRLAHDVRKPAQQLQAILHDTLAQFRPQIPVAMAETLDGALKQLEQMRDLIATRVGVSVAELKEQAHRDSRKDKLNQLLADAVWLWRLRANREGKTITISVEPDPAAVVAVPRYLVVEVLENLVSNAMRFAKKHLDVKATVLDSGGRRSIRFSVSDDGPGISHEIRDRMSRPYYSTTATLPGLGLQLCRFIVEDLLEGSNLEMSSSHEGATVAFTIPEASL